MCRSWQSAAQFFFFLPKFFMALCHERHAQSKCMPSMAECCPIFFFSFFFKSIYTNPKLLAFIQETCWHLYKKKTCWHLYKRVSLDSVSLGGGCIYTNPKLMAFIQETCWHLYKKKTCWHLYKRVSSDSVSWGGCIYTN